MDRYTKSRERLSYARLCIQVNASEPLQNTITIEKEDGGEFTQKVLFDWKPLRCNFCSCFGHAGRQCPKQVKPKQVCHVKKQPQQMEEQQQAIEPTQKVINSVEGGDRKQVSNKFDVLSTLEGGGGEAEENALEQNNGEDREILPEKVVIEN